MNSMNEKFAYLKGLRDGLEIDDKTKEGKMFNAIIDVLDVIIEELNFRGFEDEDFYENEELEISCPNCNETVKISFEECEENLLKCPKCNFQINLDEI